MGTMEQTFLVFRNKRKSVSSWKALTADREVSKQPFFQNVAIVNVCRKLKKK